MNKYTICRGYRIIGIYQILCASWGVHLLVNNVSFLYLLFIAPFLVLLLLAGLNLILQKGEKPFRLTIINQLLQIFQFQIGGNGFSYAVGVYVSLVMDAPDFNHFFVDAHFWWFMWFLYFNVKESDFYIAINFIPVLIILIVLLLSSYKQAFVKARPRFKLEQ
jgi:hypothetical protein